MNSTATASETRKIRRIVRGMPATDGAGVRMTRIIGTPELPMLDPFLLLDCFESDNPDDYIAGFPSHPHRGFETVTYLLDGRLRHEDNQGHAGVIEPGGVQWMTAGRGIVHSEMPEQENGLLKGFQLWINLPAAHKMTAPSYREFDGTEIPVERRDNVRARVITGTTSAGTVGPVRDVVTQPLYLDVSLDAGAAFEESVPAGHSAFLYVIDGEAALPLGSGGSQPVGEKHVAVLTEGETVSVRAGAEGARFLLIAARRLDEPVARGGPFVMNTQAELRQAFLDYQAGRF